MSHIWVENMLHNFDRRRARQIYELQGTSAGASHFQMSPFFWTSLEILRDDRRHSTMQSGTTSCHFFFFFSLCPFISSFIFNFYCFLPAWLSINLMSISSSRHFLTEMFFTQSASSTSTDVFSFFRSKKKKIIRQRLVWGRGQTSPPRSLTLDIVPI